MGGEGVSFVLMLLRTFVALAIVCALAYIIFRWLLPRLQQMQPGGKVMRVVDTLALGERQRVFILEVADRYYLVSAAAGQSVQLLSELDAQAAAEIERRLQRETTSGNMTMNRPLANIGDKFARTLKKQINSKGKNQ